MFFSISFVHWLVIISAFVSLFGSWAYIRDTISGKTRPNRLSWTMWAIAPLIGTGAALYAQADPWTTVRIFLAGFIPLLIVLFSFFNRKSYWKLGVFDFICGAFSLVALVAWLLADSPRFAILLAAIGDGFAALPTIRKAWINPETETGLTYITSLISVVLVLPSIPVWNVENASFQVYLLIVNTVLILAVYRKQIFWFKKLNKTNI